MYIQDSVPFTEDYLIMSVGSKNSSKCYKLVLTDFFSHFSPISVPTFVIGIIETQFFCVSLANPLRGLSAQQTSE